MYVYHLTIQLCMFVLVSFQHRYSVKEVTEELTLPVNGRAGETITFTNHATGLEIHVRLHILLTKFTAHCL